MKSQVCVDNWRKKMIDITQEEIMRNWNVDNTNNPLVSIRCITYNHEPYIIQALDGFLMQKTTFPFEVIVHDDASTDKTANIIREYESKFPKIIKPIYEIENQYSKADGSLGRIMDASCKGKYIAFCEGDDYWIDKNKLQMQVDFLENNPEYGMCYTQAYFYNQTKQQFEKDIFGTDFVSFEKLLKGNVIPTLSTCYKSCLYKQYLLEIQPENKHWLMGDYPRWLYFSKNSKVKFFPSITCVYRVLENSASHTPNFDKRLAFVKSTFDIQKFFCDKYSIEFDTNVELKIYAYECLNFLKKEWHKEWAQKYLYYYGQIEKNNLKLLIKKSIFQNKLFFTIYKKLKF